MASYFQGDDLRSYFHTFSRAFSREGQNFLDAAPFKSGHNVSADDVRAGVIPFFANEAARDAFFGAVEAGSYVEKDGLIFFNKYPLTANGGSNDQTYELIFEGAPLQGFIDPTDAWDAAGNAAAGYTAHIYNATPAAGSDGEIFATTHLWTFDPFNGRVQFKSDDTPKSGSKTGSKFAPNGITFTGVAYKGKTVSSELSEIWKSLGKNSDNPDLTIADRVADAEDRLDVIEAVKTTVNNGLSITSSDAKSDKEISLVLTSDTNGLELTAEGIKSKVELVKDTTNTTLTKYQLQINGVAIGDAIEIDKERYITSGSYDPIAQELVLGIAGQEDPVRIPVTDLITEHVAGAGISINDINVTVGEGEEAKTDVKREISIKKDVDSETFFYVDSTKGVGVSGVQAAIDLAADMVISGVTVLPTTPEEAKLFKYNTLAYTMEGQAVVIDHVTGTITPLTVEVVNAIDETSDADDNKIVTVKASETFVNSKLATLKSSVIDPIGVIANNANDNMLTNITATFPIVVTEKADKTQNISIDVSNELGNSLEEKETGLFVQGYKAGKNITFEKDTETGLLTINGANDYVLPVATDTVLGGVKSGEYVSVDTEGEMVVKKVEYALTAFGKSFNGSENISLVADDVVTISQTVASSDALTVTKTGDANKASYTIDLDESKIVGSKANDLTFAKDAEYTWDAIKTLDVALVAEAESRDEAISGLVTRIDAIDNATSGTVKGLDTRLTTAEGDIDSLEGRLTTAEGDIDSLEGRMTTAEGDIDSLEERMTTAEGDIDTLQSDVATLKTNSKVITGIEAIKVTGGEAGSNSASVALVIDDNVFGQTTNGLTSKLTIKALANAETGYAATYQLQGADGQVIGDRINIPKDQFLSKAEIVTATADDKAIDSTVVEGEKYIKLTFQVSDTAAVSVKQPVYIATKDLISEYSAGKGIQLDSNNKFNLVADSLDDTTKYLVIGEDTIGLSGISQAIANADAILSGAIGEGFSSTSTVKSAIEAVDGKVAILNGDVATSGSVKYAIYNNASEAKYVNINGETSTISAEITANANAIKTLNSDKNVEGSVDYKIAQYDSEITSLITDIENLNKEINGNV